VEANGVATPAGWAWAPSIPTEVIAQVWSLAPGDLMLCDARQPPQRIAAEHFAVVTRSAVRETWEALKRA
jgi:hypothetical protein